jgi:hypothetical protein
MTQRSRKVFTLLTITGALAAASVPAAQARQGADDPVGHDVGDDNGGLVVSVPAAGGGVDDPANHDANDDRKASGRKAEVRHRHRHHGRHHARVARHGGQDDPANHDAGDDRGTR